MERLRKQIAMLVEDGYDRQEAFYPVEHLTREGAQVTIIGTDMSTKPYCKSKPEKGVMTIPFDRLDPLLSLLTDYNLAYNVDKTWSPEMGEEGLPQSVKDSINLARWIKTSFGAIEENGDALVLSASARIQVQKSIVGLSADDFDALVIPGGFECPQRLRVEEKIINFVRAMHEQGKWIAAICHAPQVLISAGILQGAKITSYVDIKQDVINAGVTEYIDEGEAVVDEDKKLITSHHYKVKVQFCGKIVEKM